VRPLYSQTRLSRLPRKTLSPPSSQSKPTPNTQHTTRDAAPNPQKSKRNPTDRPKATFASAPTMQPNPAQSSPTRDSLATFATVVCQSRLPEAASENAPETNFGNPRSQQRNAKVDLTIGLRARREPSTSEWGKVKSNETHKCPKSSQKPTSPDMCEGEGKGRRGEGDHLATTLLRSRRTKHSEPRIKKVGSSCNRTASLRKDQARWAKDKKQSHGARAEERPKHPVESTAAALIQAYTQLHAPQQRTPRCSCRASSLVASAKCGTKVGGRMLQVSCVALPH
jgi:hypothetical protein